LRQPWLQALAVEAVAAWGVDRTLCKAGHGRAAADAALHHVAGGNWSRGTGRLLGWWAGQGTGGVRTFLRQGCHSSLRDVPCPVLQQHL
jgi:hypothetical protein